MIRENQRFFNAGLILIDIFVITISFYLAYYIRFETEIFGIGRSIWVLQDYMLVLLAILPLYILLYNLFGLYRPHRTKSLSSEAVKILKVNFLGLLGILSFLFIINVSEYSRILLALFFLFNTSLVILERIVFRLLLRSLRSRGYNIKYVLFIGAGDLGKKVAWKIKENEYLGYNIIGYLDDNLEKGSYLDEVPVIGRIEDLEIVILNNPIDRIIINLSPRHYDLLKDIVDICEKHGIRADIVPDYYRYFPAKPYLDQIEDVPIINIRHVPLDNSFNRAIKRIFDFTLAVLAIIFLSPLMIFTALMVKITSPGPIIFKQERVGHNQKTFPMYKFRSMKVEEEFSDKAVWTTPDDPRKTGFGSFIRRTSIDELPQLFNVLKGEMSLIGPRPERPVLVEKFREEIPKYMIKHHVRPGMSGWAQINGWRGDTSIKRRIEYDIHYVENWSFMMDLRIFFLTLIKGFIHKNAY